MRSNLQKYVKTQRSLVYSVVQYGSLWMGQRCNAEELKSLIICILFCWKQLWWFVRLSKVYDQSLNECKSDSAQNMTLWLDQAHVLMKLATRFWKQ